MIRSCKMTAIERPGSDKCKAKNHLGLPVDRVESLRMNTNLQLMTKVNALVIVSPVMTMIFLIINKLILEKFCWINLNYEDISMY